MTDQDLSPDAAKNPRPKIVTLLSIGTLVFSCYHLLRLSQILSHWEILTDLPLSQEPAMQVMDSMVWSGTGVLVAASLWQGKRWAWTGSLLYGITYTVIQWIKYIWIFEPAALQDRWPVNLALTIIGLGGLAAILNLKSTRSYFGKIAVKIP